MGLASRPEAAHTTARRAHLALAASSRPLASGRPTAPKGSEAGAVTTGWSEPPRAIPTVIFGGERLHGPS